MRNFPPNSPQAMHLALTRVLEAIAAINECLPTSSGVQAATAGLVNSCVTFEIAESVLALQIETALCWFAQGGAVSCNRPWPCDLLFVNTANRLDPTGATKGDLNIYDPWMRGVEFTNLVVCTGNMIFTQQGTQDPPGNPFLETISAPLLTQVDGYLFTAFNTLLQTVSFPELVHVGGDCVVGSSSNQHFTDISKLQTVGGLLSVGGVLNEECDMSALISIGGIASLGETPVISCPNLTTIGGNLIELGQNGPTHTVDLTGLTSFDGDFVGTNAAFSEATVNSLLEIFDACGLTGRNLRFDGGTSAAPTGAGITAMNNLIGRGCTVQTN